MLGISEGDIEADASSDCSQVRKMKNTWLGDSDLQQGHAKD